MKEEFLNTPTKPSNNSEPTSVVTVTEEVFSGSRRDALRHADEILNIDPDIVLPDDRTQFSSLDSHESTETVSVRRTDRSVISVNTRK